LRQQAQSKNILTFIRVQLLLMIRNIFCPRRHAQRVILAGFPDANRETFLLATRSGIFYFSRRL
jgi:hypothetical protein